MKNIISLVLVLFSTAAYAANGSGNVSNIFNIGGFDNNASVNVAEANAQGYFSMHAGGSATSSSTNYPFYKDGAIYQVPSGKVFRVVKTCGAADTANNQWQFMHATATFARGTATGSLTGAVFQSGVSTQYAQFNNVTAYAQYCYNVIYEFPALSWPGLQLNASIGQFFTIWGKEI